MVVTTVIYSLTAVSLTKRFIFIIHKRHLSLLEIKFPFLNFQKIQIFLAKNHHMFAATEKKTRPGVC